MFNRSFHQKAGRGQVNGGNNFNGNKYNNNSNNTLDSDKSSAVPSIIPSFTHTIGCEEPRRNNMYQIILGQMNHTLTNFGKNSQTETIINQTVFHSEKSLYSDNRKISDDAIGEGSHRQVTDLLIKTHLMEPLLAGLLNPNVVFEEYFNSRDAYIEVWTTKFEPITKVFNERMALAVSTKQKNNNLASSFQFQIRRYETSIADLSIRLSLMQDSVNAGGDDVPTEREVNDVKDEINRTEILLVAATNSDADADSRIMAANKELSEVAAQLHKQSMEIATGAEKQYMDDFEAFKTMRTYGVAVWTKWKNFFSTYPNLLLTLSRMANDELGVLVNPVVKGLFLAAYNNGSVKYVEQINDMKRSARVVMELNIFRNINPENHTLASLIRTAQELISLLTNVVGVTEFTTSNIISCFLLAMFTKSQFAEYYKITEDSKKFNMLESASQNGSIHGENPGTEVMDSIIYYHDQKELLSEITEAIVKPNGKATTSTTATTGDSEAEITKLKRQLAAQKTENANIRQKKESEMMAVVANNPKLPTAQAGVGRGSGSQDTSGGGGKGDSKLQPCFRFLAGHCTHGQNCRFFHENGLGGSKFGLPIPIPANRYPIASANERADTKGFKLCKAKADTGICILDDKCKLSHGPEGRAPTGPANSIQKQRPPNNTGGGGVQKQLLILPELFLPLMSQQVPSFILSICTNHSKGLEVMRKIEKVVTEFGSNATMESQSLVYNVIVIYEDQEVVYQHIASWHDEIKTLVLRVAYDRISGIDKWSFQRFIRYAMITQEAHRLYTVGSISEVEAINNTMSEMGEKSRDNLRSACNAEGERYINSIARVYATHVYLSGEGKSSNQDDGHNLSSLSAPLVYFDDVVSLQVPTISSAPQNRTILAAALTTGIASVMASSNANLVLPSASSSTASAPHSGWITAGDKGFVGDEDFIFNPSSPMEMSSSISNSNHDLAIELKNDVDGEQAANTQKRLLPLPSDGTIMSDPVTATVIKCARIGKSSNSPESSVQIVLSEGSIVKHGPFSADCHSDGISNVTDFSSDFSGRHYIDSASEVKERYSHIDLGLSTYNPALILLNEIIDGCVALIDDAETCLETWEISYSRRLKSSCIFSLPHFCRSREFLSKSIKLAQTAKNDLEDNSHILRKTIREYNREGITLLRTGRQLAASNSRSVLNDDDARSEKEFEAQQALLELNAANPPRKVIEHVHDETLRLLQKVSRIEEILVNMENLNEVHIGGRDLDERNLLWHILRAIYKYKLMLEEYLSLRFIHAPGTSSPSQPSLLNQVTVNDDKPVVSLANVFNAEPNSIEQSSLNISSEADDYIDLPILVDVNNDQDSDNDSDQQLPDLCESSDEEVAIQVKQHQILQQFKFVAFFVSNSMHMNNLIKLVKRKDPGMPKSLQVHVIRYLWPIVLSIFNNDRPIPFKIDSKSLAEVSAYKLRFRPGSKLPILGDFISFPEPTPSSRSVSTTPAKSINKVPTKTTPYGFKEAVVQQAVSSFLLSPSVVPLLSRSLFGINITAEELQEASSKTNDAHNSTLHLEAKASELMNELNNSSSATKEVIPIQTGGVAILPALPAVLNATKEVIPIQTGGVTILPAFPTVLAENSFPTEEISIDAITGLAVRRSIATSRIIAYADTAALTLEGQRYSGSSSKSKLVSTTYNSVNLVMDESVFAFIREHPLVIQKLWDTGAGLKGAGDPRMFVEGSLQKLEVPIVAAGLGGKVTIDTEGLIFGSNELVHLMPSLGPFQVSSIGQSCQPDPKGNESGYMFLSKYALKWTFTDIGALEIVADFQERMSQYLTGIAYQHSNIYIETLAGADREAMLAHVSAQTSGASNSSSGNGASSSQQA